MWGREAEKRGTRAREKAPTLRPSVGNPREVSSVLSSSTLNASASALVETICVDVGFGKEGWVEERRVVGETRETRQAPAPGFFLFFFFLPESCPASECLTNRVPPNQWLPGGGVSLDVWLSRRTLGFEGRQS